MEQVAFFAHSVVCQCIHTYKHTSMKLLAQNEAVCIDTYLYSLCCLSSRSTRLNVSACPHAAQMYNVNAVQIQ
jgi:hypothetical protein